MHVPWYFDVCCKEMQQFAEELLFCLIEPVFCRKTQSQLRALLFLSDFLNPKQFPAERFIGPEGRDQLKPLFKKVLKRCCESHGYRLKERRISDSSDPYYRVCIQPCRLHPQHDTVVAFLTRRILQDAQFSFSICDAQTLYGYEAPPTQRLEQEFKMALEKACKAAGTEIRFSNANFPPKYLLRLIPRAYEASEEDEEDEEEDKDNKDNEEEDKDNEEDEEDNEDEESKR